MKKQSAGLLLYRKQNGTIELLLGHAGGPFWAKKDKGAWSIPKGEFTDDEDPLHAARREFAEELGAPAPDGTLLDLGSVKRSDGKTVFVWAVEGDFDAAAITSNTFDLEWPPKSGTIQQFPEFDRAAWFEATEASVKLPAYQAPFVTRLAEQLRAAIDPQTKLF